MKKLCAGLLMLAGMFVQVAGASKLSDYGTDVKEATSKYAFSCLSISYYDHFHEGQPAEKNLMATVPLLNLGVFGVDTFATFEGNYIREAGLRFPVMAMRKMRLDPWVFRNYEANSYGWGISATVRLH